MANVATSVRIAADASGILSELATKLGKSKAQVIEAALKEFEERIFWSEVRGAFERSAGDPEEGARQKAEIELWDRTSDSDFKAEAW
jgi:predicted transcriptional regulator